MQLRQRRPGCSPYAAGAAPPRLQPLCSWGSVGPAAAAAMQLRQREPGCRPPPAAQAPRRQLEACLRLQSTCGPGRARLCGSSASAGPAFPPARFAPAGAQRVLCGPVRAGIQCCGHQHVHQGGRAWRVWSREACMCGCVGVGKRARAEKRASQPWRQGKAVAARGVGCRREVGPLARGPGRLVGAAMLRLSAAAPLAPPQRRAHTRLAGNPSCWYLQFGYTVYRRVLGYYSNDEDAFGAPLPAPMRRFMPASPACPNSSLPCRVFRTSVLLSLLPVPVGTWRDHSWWPNLLPCAAQRAWCASVVHQHSHA